MPSRPSKDFNKPRLHLYSVSVTATAKGDPAKTVARMAKKIAQLAKADKQDGVTVQSDDGALAKMGIFFMKAPEKFAAKVKQLPGIAAVEKPAQNKTPRAGRFRHGF